MKQSSLDFMKYALSLAKRHTGLTAENPSVGCIIVKDHHVVGCGTTAIGGRPHAETQALLQAQDKAFQSDVYVTLEPCSHYGKTSPCINSLIKANVARVFVGCQDPDPRVSGQGIKRLQEAGIETHIGLLHDEIHNHHLPFFLSIKEKRPLFTLKFAASLDGRITYGQLSHKKQISSNYDIQQAHLLRARHHAIAVGIQTILDDDPLLDCRLPGCHLYNPDVIVFDSSCRTPAHARIFSVPNRRVFILHDQKAVQPHSSETTAIYKPICRDIQQINSFLVSQAIHSVLIEGGATLNTFFLNSGFVDKIIPFQGNMIIGNSGRAAFDSLNTVHYLK